MVKRIINEATEHIWEIKRFSNEVVQAFVDKATNNFIKMCDSMSKNDRGWNSSELERNYTSTYGPEYLSTIVDAKPILSKYPEIQKYLLHPKFNVTFGFDSNNPGAGGFYYQKDRTGLSLDGGYILMNLAHWPTAQNLWGYYQDVSWELRVNGKIDKSEANKLFKEWIWSTPILEHLSHELQHAIDDIRSRGIIFKARKSRSHFEKWSYEDYLNLPQEVWARFTQTAVSLSPWESDFRKWYADFIKEMEGWSILSPDMKKRLTKALYKYFDWWQDIRKKKK